MTTQLLHRPEGRLAYEVHAPQGPTSGLTVLAVPGMGDLRASDRHLVPPLVAAGHRVVTTDLRGHGDSDATFSSYGDENTASDVVALLNHLGPAVVPGSSMGAPGRRSSRPPGDRTWSSGSACSGRSCGTPGPGRAHGCCSGWRWSRRGPRGPGLPRGVRAG